MITYPKQPNKPTVHLGLICMVLLCIIGCGKSIDIKNEKGKKHSEIVSSRKGADTPLQEEPSLDKEAYKDAYSILGSKKVTSSLRAVLEEMAAQGMTRQNARELGASDLSNPLVRVNEEGSIQTYIHVHTLGPEERALLESYEVIIETVNEKLGIVQAWIPFNRIYEVADLPFVKRITPPSYAIPRLGTN